MMQNTIKCAVLLSLFPFLLSGCTSVPKQKAPAKPKLPTISQAQVNLQKPQTKPQIQIEQPPADYLVWSTRLDNKERVQHYENFLRQNRVTAIPVYQLLRSARDWQKCDREPYAVPTAELWHNLLPTLKIFQYLVDKNVLRDFEVTSVYRDYSLNICAGGAPSSRHVFNSAIDFRIGSEYPSTQEMIYIESTKVKLCDFWRDHGERLNMGLGVYASGQIHIDTQGYRTWGPDHTRTTSICHF